MARDRIKSITSVDSEPSVAVTNQLSGASGVSVQNNASSSSASRSAASKGTYDKVEISDRARESYRSSLRATEETQKSENSETVSEKTKAVKQQQKTENKQPVEEASAALNKPKTAEKKTEPQQEVKEVRIEAEKKTYDIASAAESAGLKNDADAPRESAKPTVAERTPQEKTYDLSHYSRRELKEMLDKEQISRSEYDKEMARRDEEEQSEDGKTPEDIMNAVIKVSQAIQ